MMPLVAENGMDWMYANCSTTAQRGALDWRHKFRDAVAPLFEQLYESVSSGDEARIVIESCGADDYRERLEKELADLADEEIWRAGKAVRALRPEASGSGPDLGAPPLDEPRKAVLSADPSVLAHPT